MQKLHIISQLQLQPHIEGGYFRRCYTSQLHVHQDEISSQRCALSCIYYMLTDDSPIGFLHKNRSDIVHFYHAGSALTYYIIHPQGHLEIKTLGTDIANGEHPQLVVKGGCWKATVLTNGSFGLLSEAVCPGFDYEDMVLANPAEIQLHFPQLFPQIKQYIKIQKS